MSIYITNSIYLSGSGDFNASNPIVGYRSVLSPSDIFADTFEDGFEPLNMWSPDTSTAWHGDSFAGSPAVRMTQYVILYNGENEPIDYIGIARHNFGDGGYSISVQKSFDGGTVWSGVVAPRIFQNNNSILFYFDSSAAGQFRIKIEKTATVIPAPIISHIKMGAATILQRRVFVGEAPPLFPKTKTITNGSDNGQYLGRVVVRSYFDVMIKQENNTQDFVRTNIVPFLRHCNNIVDSEMAPSTFFYAWSPSLYPDDVLYCWADDVSEPEITAAGSHTGLMKWSVSGGAIA